ncbi:MAG: efflux RND transporter periplasmic adaptor subunit [Methylocapsa sp.]|nr:efflux RND transporter periplasmic adaptor subunit [Methylocapsa sp.]
MLQIQDDIKESAVKPEQPGTGLRRTGLLALAMAIAAGAIGIGLRWRHEEAVKRWTAAQAIPAVTTATPRPDGSPSKLILPGNVQAWYEAPLFARVSGFLKKWYFDYGATVKAGQVLAEIEAPDLDASLVAAKAKLNSANALVKVKEAELEFAKTTYERWKNSPKGVVSVQETTAKRGDYDTAVARLNAAVADVNAAQGEVDRLEALEGFKKIIAPFDGVVTERNTDVGALINAGSGVGGGTGPVLFREADVHEMRIFVQVPQRMSAEINVGQKATLRLPQFPDKVFDATVATTARAINESARTLLVELHADNPNSILPPGSYAEVRFDLPPEPNLLSIPTSALIFREHGLVVAVVGSDDRIELRKITIGRNLGSRVEVLSGLSPSDRVVVSPPDSLANGDVVQMLAPESPPDGGQAAAKGDAQ